MPQWVTFTVNSNWKKTKDVHINQNINNCNGYLFPCFRKKKKEEKRGATRVWYILSGTIVEMKLLFNSNDLKHMFNILSQVPKIVKEFSYMEMAQNRERGINNGCHFSSSL